jgi:hypothetical protein
VEEEYFLGPSKIAASGIATSISASQEARSSICRGRPESCCGYLRAFNVAVGNDSTSAQEPLMNRRRLLTRAVTAAILPVLPRLLRVDAGSANAAATRRRRPSDPLWPDAASWERLNQ